MTVLTKTCPRCKRPDLIAAEHFALRYKNRPGYYASYCKKCDLEAGKEYRKRHRGPRFYADTLSEYLAQHITPLGPTECWNWRGRCSPGGYGEACFKRQRKAAHVFAYQAYYGYVPKNLCVLHTCDNPPCCNPHHLWVGTLAQNNHDRNLKGHTAHRVTIPQVQEARRLYAEKKPIRAIATQLGIAYTTTWYIVHHKTHTLI